MKRYLWIALLLAIVGLCANDGTGQDKTMPDKVKEPAKDNVAPAGFSLLFNGKDLTNWQGVIPIATPVKRAAYAKEAKVKAVAAEYKAAVETTLVTKFAYELAVELQRKGKGSSDVKTAEQQLIKCQQEEAKLKEGLALAKTDLAKAQLVLEKAQKAANEKFLPHWTVKEGVLYHDGKGDHLQTAKDYGNIELYVDWKIAPKGDSGIYLRGNPQVQIWDYSEPSFKKFGAHLGSGGLWNNTKIGRDPLVLADNPIGQWNTMHVVMKGAKVTVKLNGKLVVDNAPLENYWERGKPLPARGPIELQHHDGPLWFKNIYLKELPD